MEEKDEYVRSLERRIDSLLWENDRLRWKVDDKEKREDD